VRPSGIIAMNLGPGDELGWARSTAGNQEFIIVTAGGRALRFAETEVRAMGRSAAGVGAIDLSEEDSVACFDVVEPGGDLLIITQNGYGKRTPLSEYPVHGRKTGGQWTLAHTRLEETGKVVAARVVQPEDQVTLITSNGIALRTPVAAISQMSRMTRGVRIVNPDGGDTVAAMARLAATVEGMADEDEGRKTVTRRGQGSSEGRTEGVEEAGVVSDGENGDGETPEGELAAVGDAASDATQ
jgi:DNA gyrase subunit A